MIPRIAKGGGSFQGASRYYLHDKGGDTRERVAWTHTENLLTTDPDRAWKFMAFTAMEAERLKEVSGQKRTGRKLTKPVFSYSLSWHPEETPDKGQMLAAAQQSLRSLGMTEHQILIIAHRDEPHRHVHVLVNRVHPSTGLACDLKNSKRKLSDFAREYEREHKVYCKQREQNHLKREKGEQTRYRDPNIVSAWERSDNGRGFAAALKENGYQLAQGRKRLVVVDPYGQTINPLRHLENIRAKELASRLQDIDMSRLPDASELSRQIQEKHRQTYDASVEHDRTVAEQENRRQSRQQEESAAVSNRHHLRIERERAALADHYGLEDQRQAIDRLSEKVSKPLWWRRILGLDRRDRTQLEELRLGMGNVEGRIQERIAGLERDRDRELADLRRRHERERLKEQEKMAASRPREYLNEQKREELRQRLEKGRESAREGPSLRR